MFEKTRKICCMFDEKNPDHAVEHNDLSLVRTEYDSYRNTQMLYRCRKCGAYVYYDYEEIANLYGGWDNAKKKKKYYPVTVEVTEQEGEEPAYNWAIIPGAKWIYGHNLELDTSRQYVYRED